MLYSTFTAFLGFEVNEGEYKVMGMSAFGKPTFTGEFREIIDIRDDGSFKLNMDYFAFPYKIQMFSKKLLNLFGEPRKPEGKVTKEHMDIAASLQAITEEAIFKALNHLYKESWTPNLCYAGGVALNSVANGKILSKTPFKRVFIQPAAGDAGTSLGAAAFIYNQFSKKNIRFETASLGPWFSEKEIKNFLEKNKINYFEFPNRRELLKKTAELVWENNVVGWFQGRMEFGPRALGNRSILANPCKAEMKDILNEKVKHREQFRPFAPVIIEEAVNEFFEADRPLPEPAYYMLMVYPIKEEKRKLIPAVTHVDGSGRLQVIKRKQNPLYYDLIKEFESLSGIPILINTSFNIRGEPIVCTPKDAFNCMMGTEIDHTVMGNFLIKRRENL